MANFSVSGSARLAVLHRHVHHPAPNHRAYPEERQALYLEARRNIIYGHQTHDRAPGPDQGHADPGRENISDEAEGNERRGHQQRWREQWDVYKSYTTSCFTCLNSYFFTII